MTNINKAKANEQKGGHLRCPQYSERGQFQFSEVGHTPNIPAVLLGKPTS